jgi:hypothetical protein
MPFDFDAVERGGNVYVTRDQLARCARVIKEMGIANE